MNITTIGRGAIGGTLGRLWTAEGHEVTELGRDGGHVGSADVVLLAVPYGAVPDALAGVTGWSGQVVIDATNRLGGEHPPEGHMEPVNGGVLEQAATQEAFAFMFVAIVKDVGDGLLFYRFASPGGGQGSG
jgi:hypothetical protein